jgi:hypothetical protein
MLISALERYQTLGTIFVFATWNKSTAWLPKFGADQGRRRGYRSVEQHCPDGLLYEEVEKAHGSALAPLSAGIFARWSMSSSEPRFYVSNSTL